jgi:hypothetical protein
MHSTVHQSVLLTDGFWMAEFVLCLALLVFRRKQVAQFFWLKSFLWLKVVSFLVLFPLVKWHPFGTTATQKYQFYFIPYWAFYAIEAFICFMVIRELFLVSLEPLEGLRRLGMILFAWVAAIAAVVALAVSIGPSHSGVQFMLLAVSQFQRCQGVLQLSLLVFLFMVARPLGVTTNNRIFGASIGFSILAVSDLIYSGWFHSQTLLSSINIFHAASLTIALCIWTIYAYLPEPKRVPVTLPMTSALLRWNEVAKSLGKSGGRVMVVGNHEALEHDMAAWDQAVAVVNSKHSTNAA